MIRLAVPADAQTLVDLANGQRPLMESIFGPQPEWTLDFAQKVIARDLAVYLYENPAPQAFIRVVPVDWGEHGVTFVMLQTGSTAQRTNRFKAAIREFGASWFPDAEQRGAPLCSFVWKDSERSFSRTGGWDKVGQFGTITVDEAGMVWWKFTPQQGLAGVATV